MLDGKSSKSRGITSADFYTYAPVFLLLLYAFFYQAFFTAAVLKYSLLGLAFLVAVLAYINKRIITKHFVIWLTLIVYMAATSVTRDDIPVTLAIILCITLLCSGSGKWVDRFIGIVLAFCTIHALITIACWIVPQLHSGFIVPVFFSGFASRDTIGYQSGFTSHYSTNGMYLGFGTVAAFIMFLNASEADRRKRLVQMILIAFALILTTKRTHLAAAVLAAVVVYLAVTKLRGKLLSGTFKTVVAVVVFLSAFVLLASFVPVLGDVVNRFAEIGEDDTLHGRSFFYDLAYSLWIANPIFGSGWGGFSDAFNHTQLGMSYIASGYLKIQPHNVYLQLLADVGLFGLGLFLIAAIGSLLTTWKALSFAHSANSIVYASLQFSLGVQVFYLICGFTGNPLNDLQMYTPYLIACAAAYGCFADGLVTSQKKQYCSEEKKGIDE